MQTALRLEDGKTIELLDVPLTKCVHSRFNTRKTRDAEAVKRLAERIMRNGFERTRALWAVEGDGVYEIFAGGTRLEAAKLAELESVPVMLHQGFTDEEISRRADEDNENDEYHLPVTPVDVWVEYARLADKEHGEGWTRERIAQAKGVSRPVVAKRIRYHTFPAGVKDYVRQGLLTEGHLDEIAGVFVVEHLATWLTTEQAWEELAEIAVKGMKTVRAVRDDATKWKQFIQYAEQVYNELPEMKTLYEIQKPAGQVECKASKGWVTQYEYKSCDEFVRVLRETEARSLAKVKAAEGRIRQFIKENLERYERWIAAESAEAAQQAQKQEREQRIAAKFHHGDCVEAIKKWTGPPIRLLLTDPPYGMDYQTNRRKASPKPDKIHGDAPSEAMGLLDSAIKAAYPNLAEHAHVLVFCDWKHEPEVRTILQAVGLEIKPTLNWIKENHTAGDLDGSFAVDYEYIVHAVKGSPQVTPRRNATFNVARSRETTHQTEKPVALLLQLIDSTTSEGDMVIDLFAGQASALVAAFRSGRDFWGAEVDPNHHDEGLNRLLAEVSKHERKRG